MRQFLVCSLLVIGVLASTPLPTGSAVAVLEPPRQRRPAWWRDDGVVIAGSWEALPYRLRRGTADDHDAKMEAYRREQTADVARRLKEIGFNLVMIPLYMGFGLAHERAAMEDARRFTAVCHSLGLRVGCYTFSGTIGYEAMLAENPAARDWLVKDQNGGYTYYDTKYYRRWANRSHPGLRAHLKEVVRFAVSEAKVDLVHMDNYMVGPGYEAYSVEQFRRFLTAKHSPLDLARRLGFSRTDFIDPPPTPPQPDAFNQDPIYQDWLDYRCETQADTYRELAEYARSLNPEIVMECNPHGYYGRLNNAVDHTRLIGWGGAFWDEGYPSRLEDGRMIARFRSHKLGRTFGNMVFQYTPTRVAMAESMANNLQTLGCPAWFAGGEIKPMVPPRPADRLDDKVLDYIGFFRREQRLFRDAEEVADVGVLNTFASTAYGPSSARAALSGFEQALYQGKVPFTLVPGRYPGDLRRFKAVVLADVPLVSDALLDAVRAFVAGGGGLVMTGEAGVYDEAYHRRKLRGLADLFPEPLGGAAVRATPGKGRAVYLPRVAVPEKFEIGMLPANRAELLEAVRWAAGEPLAVSVAAPETVTMALYRQPAGTRLLHLVNYDEDHPVERVEVRLRLDSKRAARVTLLSPDSGARQALEAEQRGAELRFTVPRLEVYGLVVVE